MKGKWVHIPRRFVKDVWGGTESVIVEMSEELTKLGFEPEIHTSMVLSTKRQETIFGIPVKRYPFIYPYVGLTKRSRELMDAVGGNLVSLRLMIRLLCIKNVHVFHLHTLGRLAAMVRFVSKLRKIPYVVTIHGGYLDMTSDQKKNLSESTGRALDWGKVIGWLFGSRLVIRDAKAIFCISKKEEALLRSTYPEKDIIYVPNGVDVLRFQGGQGSKFRKKHNIQEHMQVVLCVGRISKEKNQLNLVIAFKELLNERQDVTLVLIGPVNDAEYESEIRSAIRGNVLEKQILILPYSDYRNEQLINAYSAANIFVLPSINEAFGIVILESWASRTPVIAAKVGGVESLIRDGINGLFIDPADPSSITMAMSKIMDSKELGAVLVKNGAESVLHYKWSVITKKIVDKVGS